MKRYFGRPGSWLGFYEPPRLNFYDIYISETSLYDVAKDRLVWSGIVKTTDLGNVGKKIKDYVEVVIQALKKRNHQPASPRLNRKNQRRNF
jgi:hypothetical protein